MGVSCWDEGTVAQRETKKLSEMLVEGVVVWADDLLKWKSQAKQDGEAMSERLLFILKAN